jgi:uncharacterized protein (DUF1330 family)
MSAYIIAELDITDPAAYEEYKQRVPAVIASDGGRYIVRGGAVESLENGWSPIRVANLEFPSMQHARDWYRSPEYAPLIHLRMRAAKSRLTLVDGIPQSNDGLSASASPPLRGAS